jgi:hypothetical protein
MGLTGRLVTQIVQMGKHITILAVARMATPSLRGVIRPVTGRKMPAVKGTANRPTSIRAYAHLKKFVAGPVALQNISAVRALQGMLEIPAMRDRSILYESLGLVLFFGGISYRGGGVVLYSTLSINQK